MKKMTELIESKLQEAFREAGLDESYGRVGLSNRPDLCEYQCNGCLSAAKVLHRNPLEMAGQVASVLKNSSDFESVEAVAPGFINIKLSKEALSFFVKQMSEEKKYGVEEEQPKTIIVDYGGANVAKPLHIGHLRSAIIGESIKRLGAYMGHNMIGDVHLGDWGLQMGLIIEMMPDHTVSIDELEKIYPAASAKAKEDPDFAERAHQKTLLLQSGDPECLKKWNQIMDVSLRDLKKNYEKLDVHFDLWNGESTVNDLIPGMIQNLIDKGLAYESDGALVVNVAEAEDKKEIPPCIVRKSDGAALYATSDLATLEQREELFKPDLYIYITDKRQAMHFVQVFRTARKASIVPENHSLVHIGFGTMNGKDGKPFKTRSGGVMRLEELISDTNEAVYNRITESRDITEEEARKTAEIVGLAAIKYGDLSNQASKDYIFDLDKFTAFEGNTGPYILYTIVRIKSIINKYRSAGGSAFTSADIRPSNSDSEKKLELELVRYNEVIENAWTELAPHKLCQYIYSVAEAFNSFYHEVKILSEPSDELKKSYLAKIELTMNVLLDCIHILGFEAPDKM
ncbi:MAG: arginine--tRNA ligase [Lachnospiraceae bacterium]|nr:arginine--tRNA ligase [Lachnospiraceae bacterium]